MRMVIDSNFLRTPEYDKYLSRSKNNYAVLTDYVAKEAYQHNSPDAFLKSMGTSVRYPGQMIILKGTRAICGLIGRGRGLQKRMIDTALTEEFLIFSRQIERTIGGDQGYMFAIARHHKRASEEIGSLLNDAALIQGELGTLSQKYSSEERSLLLLESKFTAPMREKLITHVCYLAQQMMLAHPEVRRIPPASEAKNTFLFRLALSMCILDFWWGVRGGSKTAKPEKIRNDIIDMYLVTYATFFDGLLSNDSKLNNIHKLVRFHLSNTFCSR